MKTNSSSLPNVGLSFALSNATPISFLSCWFHLWVFAFAYFELFGEYWAARWGKLVTAIMNNIYIYIIYYIIYINIIYNNICNIYIIYSNYIFFFKDSTLSENKKYFETQYKIV